MGVDDDPDAVNGLGADNVLPFKRVGVADANDGCERDDDELLRSANSAIAQWKSETGIPSLTQIQQLFYELIAAGASAMVRDRIVAAIIAAFGAELGGEARARKHLEPACQTIRCRLRKRRT